MEKGNHDHQTKEQPHKSLSGTYVIQISSDQKSRSTLLVQMLLQPRKTLFLKTRKLWKMYKRIRKREIYKTSSQLKLSVKVFPCQKSTPKSQVSHIFSFQKWIASNRSSWLWEVCLERVKVEKQLCLRQPPNLTRRMLDLHEFSNLKYEQFSTPCT